MAAPTIAVTINATVSTAGNRIMVIGTYSFSAAYAVGGDTFDPQQMGLRTLDSLLLMPASSGALLILARLATALPLRTGGMAAPSGKIAAAVVADPMPAVDVGTGGAGLVEPSAAADLHTYTGSFLALGV